MKRHNRTYSFLSAGSAICLALLLAACAGQEKRESQEKAVEVAPVDVAVEEPVEITPVEVVVEPAEEPVDEEATVTKESPEPAVSEEEPIIAEEEPTAVEEPPQMVVETVPEPGLPTDDAPRLSDKYPDLATGILARAVLDDLDENTLLQANDLSITEDMLAAALDEIPEEQRDNYLPFTFYIFESIATEALVRREVGEDAPAGPELGMQELMPVYFEQVVGELKVPEEEVTAFYEENREMFGEASLAMVTDDLTDYLSQEKQHEAFQAHIRDFGLERPLRLQASWVAEQSERVKENPVDKAIATGKPVLVDFYADWCGPCMQMKPTVEALKEQYADDLTVVFINVDEHFLLASRHQVASIPLMLFYDADGTLVSRQEGFMSKEELLEELKKLGVG